MRRTPNASRGSVATLPHCALLWQFPSAFTLPRSAQTILGDHSRHQEVLQILAPASFRSRPGHFEAAEGLAFDNRAGNGAVDVKVAANQLRLYTLDIDRAARITAAGKGELAVVRHGESFVEIFGPGHG